MYGPGDLGAAPFAQGGDRRGRPRARRHEQGASAVEFALVMPLLVLLLAGIIDFALIFSSLMAMHQGLGDGVRQGVVAKTGASGSCALTGVSTGTTEQTKNLICLTKNRIGLDETRVRVGFPGVRTKGGTLLICAQHPLKSASGFFNPLLSGVLRSKVQMRIEQDLSVLAPAEETPFTGGSWEWCA